MWGLIGILYAAMFVVTWGGTYSDFINSGIQIDKYEQRETLGFALLLAFSGPLGFVASFLMSGFYYHGFQWWGPPRNGKRSS